MPILTDEELDSLHGQISSKEETIEKQNETIQELKDHEDDNAQQKKIFLTLFVIALVLLIAFIGFSYSNPSLLGISTEKAITETSQQDEVVTLKTENENLKQEVSTLESQLEQKQSSVDFVEPETYFSVQIGAFERYETPTLSKDFLVLRGDENYYLNSYSIGVFQTLEEAQKLRSALEKMGFEDVFTAKYKNAKRIDIIE